LLGHIVKQAAQQERDYRHGRFKQFFLPVSPTVTESTIANYYYGAIALFMDKISTT